MTRGYARRIVTSLMAFSLAVLARPACGWAQETHRLGGGETAVYNLAGQAEVVRGSGSQVVVEVLRGGSDAGRLEIDVREVDGREALVVRYPADEVVYSDMGRGSRTQLRVRDDGSFYGDWGWERGRRVQISGSGSGMEAWADLRISVPAGNDFALYLATGRTDLQGVEGTVLVDIGSGSIFSRDSRGFLNMDTGSGEVVVEGHEGDLEIDTGSGRVELIDVRGGDVGIDTGSGSVRGSDVWAQRFVVDTGSGEIDLRAVASPRVVLDTGSGSVDVEFTQDLDDLEIDTGSGSVTVRVPPSVGAQVEMDSGSGGVDLDLPFEAREVRRDYVRGTLGDGNGRIHIDTGSGRIRIIGG
jgi:hypothetical protein